MKCGICGEETERGLVTVTLERGSTTVVFRGVPADVCSQCGERWVDGDVTRELLETVNAEVDAGVELAVRQYKAAA